VGKINGAFVWSEKWFSALLISFKSTASVDFAYQLTFVIDIPVRQSCSREKD